MTSSADDSELDCAPRFLRRMRTWTFESLPDNANRRTSMSIFDRDYETSPRTAKRRAERLNVQLIVAREVLALDKMLGGLLTSEQRSVLIHYETSLRSQLHFAEQQIAEVSRPKAEAVPAADAQSD